ncbi:MAG TPA: glycerate kinase [Methyloceanibacter sp.]|nr:glycerate kinase [Methyloceanibacter sp.]
MTPENLLKAMFKAGVDAALPALCVPAHLPPRPKGRTVIIGAGKASGAMAKALEDAWDGPLEGLVVTRYGYRVPTERLEVVEAAHPVPDEAGRDAARRIFKLVQGLTADDLVLCLISGGGSALLALPAQGVTLEDKQAMNKALLKSGATITEMNTVRKHLSAIKGGRLAKAAYPAKVVALMISDVPGDDPSIIASGPTVPDPSTNADALAIIEKYGLDVPENMRRLLDTAEETPKPGDPCFARVENIMIATPQASLEAAAKVAREAGVTPVILGDSIEGESRDVALVHAGIARQCAMRGQPEVPPCVLISGGETTITLKGKGKGGRNTEFLLALAIALQGMPHIYALAGDTDGVDGSEDNAGALIYPDTLARAEKAGLNPKAMLADNDPYSFFKGIGNLLETGPTLTNVNDLRAILIEKG